MRQLSKLIFLLMLCTCVIVDSYALDKKNFSDTSAHFYSFVDKAQFDTLNGSNFTWAIFQPINDILSHIPFDDRPFFIRTLSDKQKALFYIWELERAVVGGGLGFANFYYNYKSYYQETIKGLRLIDDTAMVKVLEEVNKVYVTKYKKITRKYNTGDWKYIQRKFKQYDEAFIDKHENTMKLLENYIRSQTDEFVRFR